MNKLELYSTKTFDDIKHIDEYGNEYWLARELMLTLQNSNWQNFEKIINKANTACENSNFNVIDHFIDVSKMVAIGFGAYIKQNDYKLSRYDCYLIVQNADPRKEVIVDKLILQ